MCVYTYILLKRIATNVQLLTFYLVCFTVKISAALNILYGRCITLTSHQNEVIKRPIDIDCFPATSIYVFNTDESKHVIVFHTIPSVSQSKLILVK